MFLGILIALLVVALDQVSKALVFGWLDGQAPVYEVTSFFNLVIAWNTGVSFSMFNNMGNMGVYILSLFALSVVVVLLYWMAKEKDTYTKIALGFVVGGAVGNVIDRVRLKAVYDFLDFHINTHHWPAFNVADSFICIGAVMILVQGLFINQGQVKGEK